MRFALSSSAKDRFRLSAQPIQHFRRRLSMPEYYHASVGCSGRTLEKQRENSIIVHGLGQLPEAEWRRALQAAAAANPGARLRLVGDSFWARWVDDAPLPQVRVETGWDGRSNKGAEVLYRTQMSLREGRSVELVVLPQPDGHTTLVLRTHHAVMDGLGTMHFYNEIFRALRGEPLLGSNASFSDVELMRSCKVKESTSKHLPTEAITGEVRGERIGDRWQVVSLGKPVKNQLAVLAAVLADYVHQHSDKPALIGVPVDLRRHAPGLRTTANFATMLLVPMHRGDAAEHFRQRLREMLDKRMEAYFPRIISIFKLLPLKLVDRLMGRTPSNFAKRKILESIVISNIGKFDPVPLSAPGFVAEAVWAVPIAGSAMVGLSCVGEEVQMSITVTEERAGDGRFEDLIAYVRQRFAS